jgi:membrane protein DedA with SNARE-associated domain
MDDLIARYGLVAVFIGAALEGDATLILAGVTGALGLLNLPLALAVGAAGAVAGDTVWYAIGRWRSAAIRDSGLYRRAGPAVEHLISRVGPWQIVIARFIYGTRGATMLLWGAWRLPLARFLFYDLLGCALWASILGVLGYAGSHSARALLGEVARIQVWLLGAVLALLVGWLGVRYARHRWRLSRAVGPVKP